MNDVLMIPVTTVQPDLVTQTDVVVYVPLASKEAHGIVKVGDGLSITQSGLLSFDDTVLTPIKNEMVQLRVDLTDHVTDYENPHRVTKAQIGLSNVDNTSDLHKPVSLATRQELDRLAGLISGADVVISYASYKDLVDDFNNLSSAIYKVGQSVYIKTHDVPDLWIYDISSTSQTYNYVSDESIIESLENNGTFQVGYYVFASLETLKVDLSDYVTIDTRQTISGVKTFTNQLGVLNDANGDVNYIKHINNNFLISASDGENIIDIDEQLKTFNFYNQPLATVDFVMDNAISYTQTQVLTDEQKEIARNNIGAGTGGSGSSVDLVWWEV